MRETVAREFMHNIVLIFGIPEVVLTGQGSYFLSELFGNTCKLLRIKTVHTIAFHPQSKVGIDRGHRFLIGVMSLRTRETGITGYPTPAMCTI